MTIAVGLVVLVGWILHIEPLKRIAPGLVSMNPLTAITFVLAGVSLLLLGHARDSSSRAALYGRACAGIVFLIGLIRIGSLVSGWDTGIDQWLFTSQLSVAQTRFPSRMAPNTALGFLLSGAALLLLDSQTRKGHRPSEILAVVCSLSALLAILGYVYSVSGFYKVGAFIPMALHTATTFVVLGLGTLLARADTGITCIVASDTAGGFMARRLLPVAILLPIGVGALRLFGERHGLYDTAFGVALNATGTILVFLGAIWWTARLLFSLDMERKATEQIVLAARADADRANRAKSEFLSRMSHELRTPLNAILGFGQLLEADELTDEQHESAELIVGAGRHLLGLINEVLDISRIEAGGMALSVEAVSLNDVVQEAITLVRPLATNAEVRLLNLVQKSPYVFVMADRQRLKQVFLNLLSNAIKYNRQQGEVRIEAHVTSSPDTGAAEAVTIKITDTGIGLRPESLERLFTPFDRLGAETTNVDGTGLGLALSKRLIELMGATISVQSEPGVGSTFAVTLSRAADPESALEGSESNSAVEPGPAGRPRAILYVEDNLSNLKLVERVLARRGNVKLMAAMQGRMGLELAREHRPDLILLDLHLPDMNGRDVLERLRADERTRAIPVVVVSADATAAQITRLNQAGARSYLTKPIDVRQFGQVLDEVFETEAAAAG